MLSRVVCIGVVVVGMCKFVTIVRILVVRYVITVLVQMLLDVLMLCELHDECKCTG